ncbi:hypothetical protein PGT21_009419 [Puccinia graminis f. sp. tritici]|uniref:Uncharacterized protein n=1 Tax=Puccinia graminis f. sp. tritici TaxID=56615 RepID=A0A5B0R1F4_PUCGR|nr:hypothetical protein PGT21_009419 [Puccinia graminis f. sp. tritici]
MERRRTPTNNWPTHFIYTQSNPTKPNGENTPRLNRAHSTETLPTELNSLPPSISFLAITTPPPPSRPMLTTKAGGRPTSSKSHPSSCELRKPSVTEVWISSTGARS